MSYKPVKLLKHAQLRHTRTNTHRHTIHVLNTKSAPGAYLMLFIHKHEESDKGIKQQLSLSA